MQEPFSPASEALPSAWIARPNQQEQFSDAFLLTLAAVAGCAISRPVPDNDSIDWTLSCRLPRRPKLDVQLKSTISSMNADGDIRYRLKAKNYRDLALTDVVVPRILVLVTVPRRVEDWVSLTTEQLVLRYAAYWKSLAGAPRMRNTQACTITIAAGNLLTPAVLRDFMLRIDAGETL